MNYQEAADFLRVKLPTLRQWVSDGKTHNESGEKIPCHKIGRNVLFFREELEAWIKGEKVGKK